MQETLCTFKHQTVLLIETKREDSIDACNECTGMSAWGAMQYIRRSAACVIAIADTVGSVGHFHEV